MAVDARRLEDLESVGKETVRDFAVLGIRSVQELKGKDPKTMYLSLCEMTEVTHDICVLDVFRCAVAQANNPRLPKTQRKWWYWSRLRKLQQDK